MDVRCQNTSSRVWHITSILLLGGWISDETPLLIFDILSQGWEMLHLLRKKEKKETETCVINWKKRDVFSNCRPLCNFCQCDQILVFHPLTRWPCQWSIQLYVFFENHQHSSSNGLLLVGRVPKYKGHVYPTILLPTKPSKKRFTIQLEDYKIELLKYKCSRLPTYNENA